MTDAHCHPWDLLEYVENAEEERRETGTTVAASSWNLEQFKYHESLAQKAKAEGVSRLFRCFALHPQLSEDNGFSVSGGLALLESLGAEGRLDAVGEAGFDLYNEKFRAGEKIQDEMFVCHLETALKYDLPLVLHVRRAMHKIFPFAGQLKKLPAVIFHSWPGSRGEGEALLRCGINVFFSFGTAVVKNHREAMTCAAFFPSERILVETDAPYQPLRGRSFSSWCDLKIIRQGIADLRKNAASPCASKEELDAVTTANFFRAFGGGD